MNIEELNRRFEDLRGLRSVYYADSKQLLLNALDEFKNKFGKDCVEFDYEEGDTVYGTESLSDNITEVQLKGLSFDEGGITFHMYESWLGDDFDSLMRPDDDAPAYIEIDLLDVAALVIGQIEEGVPFEP